MKTTTPELDDIRNEVRNERIAREQKAAADFEAANPGLIAGLALHKDRNSFAASLHDQATRKYSLSPRQISAGWDLINREAERVAARTLAATASEKKSGEVDISKIEALFATAQSNGLKRPKFYAGDVKISLAGAHSVNTGALYVVRDPDVYQGKIMNGMFKASRDCATDTLEALRALAENPSDYARMTGKQTGRCCCCGRELTDPESIANGIGPICADKWGL